MAAEPGVTSLPALGFQGLMMVAPPPMSMKQPSRLSAKSAYSFSASRQTTVFPDSRILHTRSLIRKLLPWPELPRTSAWPLVLSSVLRSRSTMTLLPKRSLPR